MMRIFRDRERRLKALGNAYLQRKKLRGLNRRCPWLPCHARDLQDCTFCVCPFYPCEDLQLGNWYQFVKDGLPGKVWDCSGCSLPHRRDIASKLLENIQDITHQSQNQVYFERIKTQYLSSRSQ